MREIDNRSYAVLDLTDRSLQVYLTNSVNLLATPINFLAFYLIATKSKREQKTFKYTLLASHVFLYVASLFYGTVANLVLLFPFPAIQCIGLLKDSAGGGFWASLVWIFLFALFIFFTFAILMVRLRIVARKGGLFDFSDTSYIMFSVCLFVYIYVPLSVLWINAYNPKSVQVAFVKEFFPANLNAFNNPSIHVDVDENNQKAMVALLFVLALSGVPVYSSLYLAVLFEIRKQAFFKSEKIRKQQKKVVNSAVFQIAILGNMVFVSLLVLVKNVFAEPEEDTRSFPILLARQITICDVAVPSALANTCLVAASIPCQLFMILNNTFYRRAVFRVVGLPSESTTAQKPSAVVLFSGRNVSTF